MALHLPSTTNHSMMSILGIPDSSTDVKTVESPVDLSNDRPRKRQRRNRTYFSEQSLQALELAFEINRYPDVVERSKIAETIREEETRVQIWFQNRRAREKKRSGKGTRNSLPVQLYQDNAKSTISSVTDLSDPLPMPYPAKSTVSPVTSFSVPSAMPYQDTGNSKSIISPVTSLSVPCQDTATQITTESASPVLSTPVPPALTSTSPVLNTLVPLALSSTTPVSSSLDVISPESTAFREPVNMVSESTPEQVVPSQTMVTEQNTAYTQFYQTQAINAHYWYLYNQQHIYSQFPFNYFPTYAHNYATPFQQVPQPVVLDLSKKKQESSALSPRPGSPTCSMFFDYSSKVVSPIAASPGKTSPDSSTCIPKVYTSSPISTKFSSRLCLPSVYKSAFSPISKLHDCETRAADRKSSYVLSSYSKEDTLSSDLLVECDILTSRDIVELESSEKECDVIVLDLSNRS